MLRRLAATVGTFVLLAAAGCGTPDRPAAPGAGPASLPGMPGTRLGGPAFPEHRPPEAPMDALEQHVAARLAPQVRAQGLRLDYLDCPRWDGRTRRLLCTAYVDGVTGHVLVRLNRGARGVVAFRAWMRDGVVATQNLVRRLEHAGYTHVDCGRRPAYPSRPGSRLVCEVHRGGHEKLVVATVVDRGGAVDIGDLSPAR